MSKISDIGKEMRLKRIFFLLGLIGLLNACVSYDFSRRIVQQGNLLPETSIKKIKVGMSKETVAMTLGSSLLSPTFNTNRWDYAYTWRKGNHPMQVKYVTLYFKGNRLTNIEEGTKRN